MGNSHFKFDSDRQCRLEQTYYCQKYLYSYSDFVSKVLFTDKCMFRLNGHVNSQDAEIFWSESSSEACQEPVHSSAITTLWYTNKDN